VANKKVAPEPGDFFVCHGKKHRGIGVKKLFTILIFSSLLGFLVLTCSFQKEKPVRLVFSAGQQGGVYFPLARSIAKVLQKDYPYIEIDVISSKGSSENVNRLMQGEADLAIIQNDTPGNASIRTIAPLYKEVLHFLARRDAGIHQFKDIVGRRVAIGPSDSGTELLVKRLLEHYGISQKDIAAVNTGMGEAADKILAGEIDVMFVVAGLKAAVCQRVLISGKVKLVGFGDPDENGGEVDGFCLDYPFLTARIIPTYSYTLRNREYPGEPQEPVATLAMRSLLVCRKEIPEGVVHDITETIFNNRAALIREVVLASQIREDFDASRFQFPLHAGARAYYQREKPFFLVTYAETMGFILSLLIAVVGMIVGLNQWISMKKKNRIDRYYIRMDDLLKRMNSQDINHQELRDIEQELSEMRHHAVRELTREKLLANESFLIFQSLLSDCQRQVQQRLHDLDSGNNSFK
jgi:TRAP transporter TAXI family solute receptor